MRKKRYFKHKLIKKEWLLLSLGVLSIIISLFIGSTTLLNNNNNVISGSAVQLIPTDLPKTAEETEQGICSVTICLNDNSEEVYCPFSYDECYDKYTECRIVECETESYEEEPESFEYVEDNLCRDEYHDCIDSGEEIICKGDFESCSESFDSCTCGTEDTNNFEAAEPDFDATQTTECESSVFVCERQTLTMSGEVAESKVTCKSSFEECSMIYGNCRCGNSTLTDFPTQYIGSDTGDSNGNEEDYWCEYRGKEIPCYMMPEDCTKSKNTCDKGNGIWITCKDKFDFCNKKYNGNCLCGIEILNSGFMTTTDE